MPTRQLYRTLVVTDIEAYGRPDRGDLIRVRLRAVLSDVLARALADAGVPGETWTATSTGDGLLALIDPSVEVARALRALLVHMPRLVADYDRTAEDPARLRVRAVLHAAYVLMDAQGPAGKEVNLAFRLLDSDPLRARLRSTAGPMVVAVTDHVYQQVVRERINGLDPAGFEQVEIEVKETRASCWVHAVDELPTSGVLTEVQALRHDSDVVVSRFTADGTRLATVTAARSVWVWDARSGDQLLRRTVAARVLAVGCDARGGYLVAEGAGQLVRLLDLATGAAPRRCPHDDQVNHASFSPDVRLLATASADGTARVWEVEGGREAQRLPHPGWVVAVQFSDDAQLVLTTDVEGTARVWEVAGGREVSRFSHAGRVLCAAFSPDQRLVVTSSSSREGQVWDVFTGERRSLLENGRMNHAEFSRDGRLMVTSGDRMARIWELQ